MPDDVAVYLDAAIRREERATRNGLWTDRDCMVHALAMLSDGDKARDAVVAAPVQVVVPRLQIVSVVSWPKDMVRYERSDIRYGKTAFRVTSRVFADIDIEPPSLVRVIIEEDK